MAKDKKRAVNPEPETELRIEEVPVDYKGPRIPELPNERYTGQFHTIVQKPHNGFQNFAIMTADVKDGVIKKVEFTQSWSGWETVARLELLNEKKMEELKRTYPAGFQSV